MKPVLLPFLSVLAALAPLSMAAAEDQDGAISVEDARNLCIGGDLDTCVGAAGFLGEQIVIHEQMSRDLGCGDPNLMRAPCYQLVANEPLLSQYTIWADEMFFKACESGIAEGCEQGGYFSHNRSALGAMERSRVFFTMGCALESEASCRQLEEAQQGS